MSEVQEAPQTLRNLEHHDMQILDVHGKLVKIHESPIAKIRTSCNENPEEFRKKPMQIPRMWLSCRIFLTR